MRSPFAYLNVISPLLLYLYTLCAIIIIITITTAESSLIQKPQVGVGGGGGGGILRVLLKQRAPIEESSIDYGSLQTCKDKSVS